MDFLIGAVFVGAVIAIIVLLARRREKRAIATAEVQQQKEEARKRQEQERKKQEKARKQQEARAECEREGHSILPMTGEPLGYKKVFVQIDRRGYQKEHCWRCGMQRVSDRRLVEIDAPEIQSEYSTDMQWLVGDSSVNIGKYSIEIDPEESSYLYLTQNVDGDLRRGSVYACMKIKGEGLFSEEHIRKNDDYPLNGELMRAMMSYDDKGTTPLSCGRIACLGKETYDSLDVYKRNELIKNIRSGAAELPCSTILIEYKDGVRAYKPFAAIEG